MTGWIGWPASSPYTPDQRHLPRLPVHVHLDARGDEIEAVGEVARPCLPVDEINVRSSPVAAAVERRAEIVVGAS